MNSKKLKALACTLLLICAAISFVRAGGVRASTQEKPDQPKSPEVEFITADELKAKLTKNDPVTIIDLRAPKTYTESENQIKGSIRFKLRKLRERLIFPPLKDLPRDREIVTYCSCPNDEASIRGAEILKGAGFKRARVLKGGWQQWLAIKGPVEQRPKP